jgi:hypothetical protein
MWMRNWRTTGRTGGRSSWHCRPRGSRGPRPRSADTRPGAARRASRRRAPGPAAGHGVRARAPPCGPDASGAPSGRPSRTVPPGAPRRAAPPPCRPSTARSRGATDRAPVRREPCRPATAHCPVARAPGPREARYRWARDGRRDRAPTSHANTHRSARVRSIGSAIRAPEALPATRRFGWRLRPQAGLECRSFGRPFARGCR